jgi:hypothetical protein
MQGQPVERLAVLDLEVDKAATELTHAAMVSLGLAASPAALATAATAAPPAPLAPLPRGPVPARPRSMYVDPMARPAPPAPATAAEVVAAAAADPVTMVLGPGRALWRLRLARTAQVVRKREQVLAVAGGEIYKTSMVSVAERQEYTLLSRDKDELQAWAAAINGSARAPLPTSLRRAHTFTWGTERMAGMKGLETRRASQLGQFGTSGRNLRVQLTDGLGRAQILGVRPPPWRRRCHARLHRIQHGPHMPV